MSQLTSNRTETIEDWLISQMAAQLQLEIEDIDTEESFVNYGLSSAQALVLISELEKWLNSKISPTLIWNYPTIKALSERLSEEPVAARQEN